MFKRESMMKSLAAALVLATLAGCGGGSPAGVDDEEWVDDPAAGGYGAPATGGFGSTPGTTPGYGAPTTGTPGYGAPGYGSTGGMAVGGDLTASVIKKKNGVFLGIGTFKCTIEVSNPSSAPKTGTLTVTFKNGSKASKTAPVTQTVSLGPNETKTFDFEDKKWSTDNVEVEITTDASSAAMPMTGGAPGGYGAPTGGYGAPATGGYGAPTTGAPTY